MPNTYSLPKLSYNLDGLKPFISEEQLKVHYEKHHNAYVTGANDILAKLDKARVDNADLDMKSMLKSLSWNIAGHLLHSLFWENLAPQGKCGKQSEALLDAINKDFGSFDRFKKEFTQAAASVEGSGWAALTYCKMTGRILVMQIEKHNANVIPAYPVLLVVDVFEHAYYIDYKNDRAKFIEGFWNIVNWDEVSRRFEAATK